MKDIYLVDVPHKWDKEKTGINHDVAKFINYNGCTIGCVLLSEGNDFWYVEWLEIFAIYRGRRLLRQIMEVLYESFGKLEFTASEELVKKYEHIGAINDGYDEFSEMTSFHYSPGLLC